MAGRAVFSLNIHRATGRNMEPSIGGAAQVNLDVDIGCRPKPKRQHEWLSTSGGNSAFEAHNPIEVFNPCVTGAERSLGPSVGQHERCKTPVQGGKRRAIE